MVDRHVVSFHPSAAGPNGVGGWDWYWSIDGAISRIRELAEEGGYSVMYKVIATPDCDDPDGVSDDIADSGKLDEIY